MADSLKGDNFWNANAFISSCLGAACLLTAASSVFNIASSADNNVPAAVWFVILTLAIRSALFASDRHLLPKSGQAAIIICFVGFCSIGIIFSAGRHVLHTLGFGQTDIAQDRYYPRNYGVSSSSYANSSSDNSRDSSTDRMLDSMRDFRTQDDHTYRIMHDMPIYNTGGCAENCPKSGW
jgi:hypothetical protein